ncbi:hypothetical protein GGR57DRAFT_24770 [Xylariaceae sp. FL1272]|nr:hypothetical protein GGR57DRAFT_24770 [Xylariaceae sp. FL1272]
MSTSTSSSSAHSQRTPLNEKSNSEKNVLGVRLVPYSPPRIVGEDDISSSGRDSRATARSRESRERPTSNDAGHTYTGPWKESNTGAVMSSPLSPASPTTSSTRIRRKDVSGSRSVSGMSGSDQRTPQPAPVITRSLYGGNITRVNAPTQPFEDQHDYARPSSPSRSKSPSRRERVINVHSDKTFSLVLRPTKTRTSTGSESTVPSHRYSSTSAFTPHEETSFDAPTDDYPSSLFSSVPERSVSPSSPGTPVSPLEVAVDHIASSPWNYRMIGGVRKVPKTPDIKDKGKGNDIVTEPLPPLPETSIEPPESVGAEQPFALAAKPSFATDSSDSTLEHTTNYKVIGRSSPPLPDSDSIEIPPSSSSNSNYQLIGPSSPPQVITSSSREHELLDTPGSNNFVVHQILDTPGSRNFIVHDSPYPASEQTALETPGSQNYVVHNTASVASSVNPFVRRPLNKVSLDSFRREVRPQYSQESLLIAPLRPHKRSSSEQLHSHTREKSKDSYHTRSNSFSSISSILTQDSVPNIVRLAHTPSASSLQQSSWAGRGSVGFKKPMDDHPWSGQLSTVNSEYEGSNQGSRLTSLASVRDRGSSGLGSRGSRHIQSINSSILETLEPPKTHSRSNSLSESLDKQTAASRRGTRELPSPPPRTIRNHDEHGDGLADLEQFHQLQSKSSRSRIGGGFLSSQSSERSLRSMSSDRSLRPMRSNSSLRRGLPTWARIFYARDSDFVIHEGDDDDSLRPSSWAPSNSPAPEHFQQSIHNPRRRPREIRTGTAAAADAPRPSSMEITPMPPGIEQIRRGPRKMTSSIWSPHLRRDHRTSGYTIWDNPPSMTWSAENRVFGQRNRQLVLFTLGFILPFAWIIAALLPLPPNPAYDVEQQVPAPDYTKPETFAQRVEPVDDSRFQSARWWRNLNRFMSVIGLLILGAIAALAVLGVNQRLGN